MTWIMTGATAFFVAICVWQSIKIRSMRDRLVVMLLRDQGEMTANQVGALIDTSPETARRSLEVAEGAGIVQFRSVVIEGRKRGMWSIIERQS